MTVRAEPGGEVRRGKLSGYGMDFWTEFNTPAPRRGSANLSAARIPPGLVVVVSVHVYLMAPGYHSLVASFTDLG